MSRLVIDASVTVDWLLEDEGTPAALEVRQRVVRYGAVVPLLWRSEVANALLVACRKGRLTRDDVADSLNDLAKMRIEPDPHTWELCWSGIVGVAWAHRLTVYDAAYLELALRRRLPLASLDRDLRAAASASGVPLL